MNEVTIDPNTIIQIIQLLSPVVLPAIVGLLRNAVSVGGKTAFWVNFVLNVAAQIIAAYFGGSPELAVGMSGAGGLAGSKYVDIREDGIDPIKYARKDAK